MAKTELVLEHLRDWRQATGVKFGIVDLLQQIVLGHRQNRRDIRVQDVPGDVAAIGLHFHLCSFRWPVVLDPDTGCRFERFEHHLSHRRRTRPAPACDHDLTLVGTSRGDMEEWYGGWQRRDRKSVV